MAARQEGNRVHPEEESEGRILRHTAQLTMGTVALEVPGTCFHVKSLGVSVSF